jgi:DNA-binding response OmpR family regulator
MRMRVLLAPRNSSEAMSLSHRPRVLLAYDDLELRCQIAQALQRDGFEVVEALDGIEPLAHVALAAADAEVWSLIATALHGDQGDNYQRLANPAH